MKNKGIKTLSYMAMFSALCFVGTLVHIPITLGGSNTMIHLGNAVLLVAALSLGGVKGGLSAAVGMAIFDLTNGYLTYAPSTFILKFLMGLTCGLVYNSLKNKKINNNTKILIALIAAGLENIIMDPIITTLMQMWIFGIKGEVVGILLAFESAATVANAVVAVMLSFIVYKNLSKTNLFENIDYNKQD